MYLHCACGFSIGGYQPGGERAQADLLLEKEEGGIEVCGGEGKKVRARRGREFSVLSTTKKALAPKAEVWQADRSPLRQVLK
jgi:hypothetical protein